MTDTRIERDPLGDLEVPASALYGVQTERARRNFPISGLKPQPAFVDAGNRAVVAVGRPGGARNAPQVSPVSPTELSERQGWRVPRLEFVGTPLSEAIAMFNEHSARWHGARIVLGDSKLERLQLSGILRADNTETLLRVLATEFGIKAERQGNDAIVLRGK